MAVHSNAWTFVFDGQTEKVLPNDCFCQICSDELNDEAKLRYEDRRADRA